MPDFSSSAGWSPSADSSLPWCAKSCACIFEVFSWYKAKTPHPFPGAGVDVGFSFCLAELARAPGAKNDEDEDRKKYDRHAAKPDQDDQAVSRGRRHGRERCAAARRSGRVC
jgi:hypothetical protein